MKVVERRSELLKLGGLGFSPPETATQLSHKHQCSGSTVYRDFECWGMWQLELQNIQNTLIYIHLEAAIFKTVTDGFNVGAAKTVEEAKQLLEVGFDYVTEMEGIKLFRKRK